MERSQSTDSSDTAIEDGKDSWSKRTSQIQWKPLRGMRDDLKRRAPYYLTDWTIGFKAENIYRVAAASIKMYFINLMPAIAYTLDLYHRTNGQYGINETILASALPTLVYPLLGVQPLTIVGFTGLINLFNYTNYTIVTQDHGVDYLQFQCWVWGAIMHWISGIFNICDYTRFITDMTAHCFGFYVGVIYIQKGIELLIYESESQSLAATWLACFVAVAFSFSLLYITKAASGPWAPLWIRQAMSDYGFAAVCVFWSGFVHIPGNLKSTNLSFLPITKAFFPTADRSWFVPFYKLGVKWIFVAMPFGLAVLNASSCSPCCFGLITTSLLYDWYQPECLAHIPKLAASSRKFPVHRPSGFHWDFFLLGWTTLVAGFLGLPAPNGLIPQAPEHAEALSVKEQVYSDQDKQERVKTVRVVEQRLSHFMIGLLTIGTMTRPLLVALGLMPRAVFAGIFIIVGWDGIQPNPIVRNTVYLIRDAGMTPSTHPLKSISKKKIALFLSIQWSVFGVAVAISQTIAAIGFPVPYILLIPFRQFVIPRWFSKEELAILDGPYAEKSSYERLILKSVANSNAVIDSIGGDLHLVTGENTQPSYSKPEKSRHSSGTATPVGDLSHPKRPVERIRMRRRSSRFVDGVKEKSVNLTGAV